MCPRTDATEVIRRDARCVSEKSTRPPRPGDTAIVTFISALKELWSRRVLVVLAVVIAAVAAILSVSQVSLSPLSLSKDPTSQANSSTEILVDSAHSPIAGSKRDLEGLV